MMTEFTPFASLVGGALIGLSAVLLMLTLGRVLGATGILAGALFPSSSADWRWRAAILAGMFSAPMLFYCIFGKFPNIEIPVPPYMTMFGGLLVGVGVTLGSGCTSGHGVCGLARLSIRSLVAVLVFMLSTAVTVYIVRHVLGANA